MPLHRTTDAAQIAPYLTHAVSHHEQVALVPADNNGRMRQANTKRTRSRQRQDRPVRTEEEMRFNVGPRSLRNLTPGNRGGRRGGRQDRGRGETNEAYPDYPPPSFLEATSVPAFSCNATIVSLSQPTSPVTSGGVVPTLPIASGEPFNGVASAVASTAEDDGSDTSSLEIVDMGSLPAEEHLPSGSKLEENIKRDWINRRGVDFPSPPECQARSRSKSRGRAILDSDTEDEAQYAPRPSSSKPKNGTLSPLRTLFPYRSMAVDQPFSASPNPSPYASRSSLPFLSATSLKMSMSTTSISSIKGEGFFSRKLLSFKWKERAKESLDAWEVVDSDPIIASDNASSPTRSQSFTYGMPTHSVREEISPPPPSASSTTSPHPLSLRDRKAPPVPFVTRPRRPAPPAPPKPAELASVPQGPILTSVRTRRSPPLPKKLPHVASSPLGHDSWRPSSLELDIESNSILQRAMVTPLPLSPVDGRSENIPTTPVSPVSPTITSVSVCELAPISSTEPALDNVVLSCDDGAFTRGMSPELPPMPGDYPDDDGSPSPVSVHAPSPPTSPMPISRHHYPGRPLPQPPGTTRPLIDSVYIVYDDPPTSPTSTSSHCPEGLLIDLDDSSSLELASSRSVPLINGDQNNLVTPSYPTSSSSIDLLGSIMDLPSPVIAQDVPPRQPTPVFSNQLASPRPTPYSEITDLDILVSRISDEERHDGSNYDALLLLSEFIGPASSPRSTSQSVSVTHANLAQHVQPNPISPTTAARMLTVSVNVPRLGDVRVERRRTTKDGRVKLKLVAIPAS
ncbi:hypothetical protein H0H87_008775 [Tephrocybe sp. NHM501043]|nr:hypothetical protein H0H87_008775 [Tephrocybe sp. NHM501043]